MATWADIQRGIFAGESGGDYGALFNYQNRPSGRFSNVDLTQMTVDEALQFADPSGPYAQYVKGQVGRVATPMGAYQVVGSTLRSAKEGLGLTGNERMTPELQDRIGQFIYKTQGTGAWAGYKGPRVSSKGNIPMDQQQPDQERRGGLMGLVDMATQRSPETGLTKLEALGAALDPLIMPEMRGGEAIRARGAQRVQRSQMNKTIEWMKNNGYGEIAAMVEQNPSIASNVMSAILSKKFETQAKPKIYSVGDKLVDETGNVIYGGDTSRYSKEQLSAMNTLRDDLRKDTEKFNLLKQGWDNIQTFYSNPGGVSDYALAVGFAKILDPGSVAREGEVAAVANSGSLGGALKSQILNALQGEGKLPPAVRQQIAQLSRQLYSNQIPEAQSVLQNYKRIAERAGLTMEDIYSGPTFKMPEEIKPAAIPMPSNWPSGQAAWDALSEQEKQEFING